MCGRTVTGDVSWRQYAEWMGILTPDFDLQPRFNNAPTTMNPVFLPDGGAMARWGLVPHWHRAPVAALKYATFNARSEDAAQKPSFRDAMRSHHCLIPVKGYYEWTGPKGAKTPHFISVKTNAPAFCMAGLYSQVDLPDFTGITYTILTEPSAAPIKGLHHRMPVMLDEGSYSDWLTAAPLAEMTRVTPDRIHFHRVGPAVGNVRNDGPELILPYE